MIRRRYSSSQNRHRRLFDRAIAPCLEALEGRQLLSVPNGPFALTATAASPTSVNLAFYDSATDETGFVVQRATSQNGTYSTITTLPAAPGTSTKVTYTDTTDSPATTYFYKVFAVNGPYQSSATTASVTTPAGTPVTAPAAPTGIAAAIVNSQVVVSFTDNSNNEADFVIQRSTSASGAYTNVGTVAGDAATGSKSFTDTSAAASTTYYYKVYAENAAGPSASAGPATVTTPPPPTQNPGGPPNGPFGMTATAKSATSVALSFYDSATNETGFMVQRATSPSGAYTTLATLPPASGSFTTVTYTDNTAAPSTTYYYRVDAINGIYQSSYTTASATTPAGTVVTAPAAPSGVGTSINNSQPLINFTDNSTNESDFVITRSTSATGVFNTVGTVTGDALTGSKSFTDTSAAASTTYYYEVYAENSAGPSAIAGPVSVTTPATQQPPPQNPGGAPNGPFAMTATAANASTVNLAFYDSATNETGFVVQRSTSQNGSYATLATLPPAAGSFTVVTYSDTTAAPSTTYYYRVYAINGIYQSGATSASVTTPAGTVQPTVPAAPSGVTAAMSGTNVVVTFNDNSNNETDFVVQRSTSATGPFATVGTVNGDATSGLKSFTDTTAAASTTYYYKVYAENAVGPSAAVVSNAITTPPASPPPAVPSAPTGVTLALSGAKVLVTFNDNSSNEADFVIRRATNAVGPFVTLGVVAGDASTGTKTFTDSTAAAWTTYYYQVYAENSAGASAVAASSSVTTPPAATNPGGPPNGPYGLSASALNSYAVQIQFGDSANNETGFVVLRSTSANGPFTQIGTITPSAGTGIKLTFVDVGVSPSSTYYYEVYAVNGPYSSGIDGPAGVTTPAASSNNKPTGTWVPFAPLIGQSLEVSDFPTINGSGVTVALIDRGVDPYAPGLSPSKFIAGYNFRDHNTNTLDDYGHGTGVAGIIAADGYTYNGAYNQGVAPGASLIMLKQESSNDIKAALDWVIANARQYNIQVINLTDFITDVEPGAADPSVYQTELQTIWNMGIFITSPVGNGEATFGPNLPIGLPASSPYVVGAGGVTPQGTMYADSRRGPGLDLLAPGYNVTMPYYIKNPNSVGFDAEDDNYDGSAAIVDYATGTSWASAYVTGTAALIKQVNSAITPDEILQILKQTGTPTLDPTNNVYVPMINVDKAVAMAEQLYGPNGTSKP